MTSPTTSESFSQAVAELRRRVVSGEWSAGGRLPSERELALELGVSRATVREVVKTLELVGLVEIRPKVGIFHRVLSHGDTPEALSGRHGRSGSLGYSRVADCIDAREVIECGSLRLVVERASDADLERLQELVDQSRAAPDEASALEYDRSFHLALHAITRNPVIQQAIGNSFDLLWEHLPAVRAIPERRDTSLRQHRLILEAVRSRDLDTAVAHMLEHINGVRVGLLGSNAHRGTLPQGPGTSGSGSDR